MKERKIRVGPWDCEEKLLDRVTLYRARQGGKPWTWVLHKALHELMDREQVFIDAHAPNMERVQNLESVSIGAAGVPAAVVPASVVPASVVPAAVDEVPVFNSINEQRMYWLLKGRADKQALLDRAPVELEKEPGSKRALNWLARMPGILAKYEVDIAECQAALEAERVAKENIGGVEPGEEV